jgi:hypothetical protein
MPSAEFQLPHSTGINPSANGERDLLHVLKQLRELETQDVRIDASGLQHIEPFGILLLSAALRRRQEAGTARTELTGVDLTKQGHSFAAWLGFWSCIGAGQTAVGQPNNDTVPISFLDYSTLHLRAGGRDPVRAGLVSEAAGQLATVLTKASDRSPQWLALEYAFREMFRNAFEHSRSDRVWYCATTLKQDRKVQIGILDEGCGIRASFGDQYQDSTDLTAVQAALRPGVSSKSGRRRSPEAEERLLEQFPGQSPSLYDNSGVGLTFTSELARRAGAFGILSGDAWIAFDSAGGRWTTPSSWHPGTAVRIVLQLDALESAMAAVGLVSAEQRRYSGSPVLSASMLSRLGITNQDRENQG